MRNLATRPLASMNDDVYIQPLLTTRKSTAASPLMMRCQIKAEARF
jgi:hypothetical protein